MRRLVILTLILIGILAKTMLPAMAQDRVWLGKSRLFTNDALGDGKDRWRTGSFSYSLIRGNRWNGELPAGFGQLVEYRFRSEIIAPSNLQNPIIGTDRRYVGMTSIGAFSHQQIDGMDVILGGELVVTGPQTGLGAFHNWAHQLLKMGSIKVLGSQIGNNIFPTAKIEIGRKFNLSDADGNASTFRPFIEAQAGVETYIRVGGDFVFGPAGRGDMETRDVVTGFRTTAIKAKRVRGTSFLIGGDAAYISSSHFLPANLGYTLDSPRIRLRAGVYHETKDSSYFYGLTWLGTEFVNQPRGQLVGSFTLRMSF